jgi:hypothetical protein
VPEWPIGAVSKTVVALVVTVGSNPTLSATESDLTGFPKKPVRSILICTEKIRNHYAMLYQHLLEMSEKVDTKNVLIG